MVYSHAGFGIDFQNASGIFDTRDEMFEYINNFVNYKLEQIYLPLTGNMLGLLIGDTAVTTDFRPIQAMKTELLRDFDREDEERHLLAFLHEFHTTLDAEIEAYRNTMPRFLLSNQRQVYSDGSPLMDPDDEKIHIERIRKLLPSIEINVTYATGPVGAHFQDFIQRCYHRATKMLELSEELDETGYEYFTIEEFRRMAEVLTAEKQGLQVANQASYSVTVALNRRTYALTRDKNPVPLHYDDLGTVTLYGGSSTSTDDAAVIKNCGEKAFIANIGTGVAKTQKVVFRGIKDEHDVIHPNVTRFSGAEISKRITFEELPRPIARNVADRNLRRNSERRLEFSELFEVPSVGRTHYSLSILSGDSIIDLRTQTNEDFATIITNTETGTALIVATAENEAGPTEVTVTVNVR